MSVKEDVILDIDIVVYLMVGGSLIFFYIDVMFFVDSVIEEVIILVNFDIEVDEEEDEGDEIGEQEFVIFWLYVKEVSKGRDLGIMGLRE